MLKIWNIAPLFKGVLLIFICYPSTILYCRIIVYIVTYIENERIKTNKWANKYLIKLQNTVKIEKKISKMIVMCIKRWLFAMRICALSVA